MTTKHYPKAKQATLESLFTSDYFRLIPTKLRELPHGISEIPVDIVLGKKFANSLSYEVPWDGGLYGFIRSKKLLFEKFSNDKIVKASICDWEDRFAVIFEDGKGKEDPVFFVKTEEVKKLLESCQRPKKIIEE